MDVKDNKQMAKAGNNAGTELHGKHMRLLLMKKLGSESHFKVKNSMETIESVAGASGAPPPKIFNLTLI